LQAGRLLRWPTSAIASRENRAIDKLRATNPRMMTHPPLHFLERWRRAYGSRACESNGIVGRLWGNREMTPADTARRRSGFRRLDDFRAFNITVSGGV
jgi:hypothetical protein